MSYCSSTFWLLLGLVTVNPTSGSLSRIARSNDPSNTDYSGGTLKITLIGSGAPGPIRPLVCYTADFNNLWTSNMRWIFPNGSLVRWVSDSSPPPAQGGDVFSFDNRLGVTFNRGPDYLTPGEYCCVRRGTNHRLCVTLSVTMQQLAKVIPFLSLGSTVIANNTEVLISDMSPGEHADTLTCHTDLITCCRDRDNNWMGPLGGEWYYPNRSQVVAGANTQGTEAFYRVRNAPQLVRLVRHHVTSLGPTGSYCCVVPTNKGEKTMCVNIAMCPSLPPLTNGTISYSDPTLGVDSVASHSCTSFTLVGDATRTCRRNGTWSGSAPYCQAICDNLPHPKNGFITYNDGLSNSRSNVMDAVYSCSPGYTLNGTATRTCYVNRAWTGSAPTCIAKDCGHPNVPKRGQVELPMGTIFNSLAYYSCDNCSRLEGNYLQLCSTDGIWSPAPPTCQVLSDCGQPSAPLNGMVIIAPNNTECGSVATYSCNTGYLLKGVQNRTCQADGQWSDVMPFCSFVDCGPLVHPRNGRVNTDSGTTYNSVATYSCNEGYYLNGSASRTCMANMEWSPLAPTCDPVNCGPLHGPSKGHVNTSQGTLFTSIATYGCNETFNLTGCNSTECLSSGSWSCDPPFCADNAMIQLKFGPTGYCVDWTDWKVNLMYLKMQSLVLRAIHSSGHVIPKENIQQGYFSCYRSTTETTYRTTITGTERVSAVNYADLIQEWVESGVTTRVQWYVIKIDKNCPVSIMSMDNEECV